MNVNAGAGKRRSVRLCAAAFQGDVTMHLGFALPVNTAVGLDDQVRALTHQIDATTNHQRVVLDVNHEVGVGLQCGDGARQQEARAALAQQHVRCLHLQRVDDAVVGAVVGVDLVTVRAVRHQPTLGRCDRCTRVGVVDRETGHQLMAGRSRGLVVNG